MTLTIDGLEKERDFYFGKLRDIEVICQDGGGEENPVLKSILNILYATEVNNALFYASLVIKVHQPFYIWIYIC